MSSKQKDLGFTLVELLIGITIFAIIVTMSVATFNSYFSRQNVDGVVENFMEDLQFARSEASASHEPVRLCPVNITGGAVCAATNTNWSNGWGVYKGNALVKKGGKIPNTVTIEGVTVIFNTSPLPAEIVYSPKGNISSLSARSSSTATEQFIVRPSSNCTAGQAKEVYLIATGAVAAYDIPCP